MTSRLVPGTAIRRRWRLWPLCLSIACAHRAPAPPTVAPAPPIENRDAASAPPTTDAVDWVACRTTLDDAARAFRRDAPALYPPYATLAWEDDAETDAITTASDDPDAAFATTTVTPGRTWQFMAYVAADEYLDQVRDVLPAPLPSTWTANPDHDFALARRLGDLSLLIVVSTERSAVAVPDHPLTRAFAARMKAALEHCGGPVRAYLAACCPLPTPPPGAVAWCHPCPRSASRSTRPRVGSRPPS